MRTMLVGVVALCLGILFLQAGEEKIAVDKLPKAISEAIKKRFPKAEITEAVKKTEGDQVTYEVSIEEGKTELDITYTADGKLTSIEKTIDIKTLPKAVTAALEEKYPKSTLRSAAEVTEVTDGKEAPFNYEVVVVTADKKIYSVEISPEGKVLDVEEQKDDTKKEEEKKEKKKDEKKKDKKK